MKKKKRDAEYLAVIIKHINYCIREKKRGEGK